MGAVEARGEVTLTNTSDTVVACGSAIGGPVALVRLSGPHAFAVAQRAGLPSPGLHDSDGPSVAAPWSVIEHHWQLGPGLCPCRVLVMPGPRTYTGADTVEIQVPGSRDVVDLAVSCLRQAGARPAEPGAFTRMAVANGRLRLDQAEAVLALVHAEDAAAAGMALDRLRGSLGHEVEAVRSDLIEARARVEAGLDFNDEDDVRSYDPAALIALLATLRDRLAAFLCTADADAGQPLIALVGPPNAGKSALFAKLTGEIALVSPVPGTTRDWLEGVWTVAGRRVRLIDTAGWLAAAAGLDAAGIQAGRERLAGASLILACSAPDAALPDPLPSFLPAERTVVVATKSDLEGRLQRAEWAVSVVTGEGLDGLAQAVALRLAASGTGDERQQRFLHEAHGLLTHLVQRLPEDALLADDLRRASDACGALIGFTATDEVLAAIFARFCIGK